LARKWQPKTRHAWSRRQRSGRYNKPEIFPSIFVIASIFPLTARFRLRHVTQGPLATLWVVQSLMDFTLRLYCFIAQHQ